MTPANMNSGNIGTQFTQFLTSAGFHVAPAPLAQASQGMSVGVASLPYVPHNEFVRTVQPRLQGSLPPGQTFMHRSVPSRADDPNNVAALHMASASAYWTATARSEAEGYRMYYEWHDRLRLLAYNAKDNEASRAAALRAAWGAANALQLTGEGDDAASLLLFMYLVRTVPGAVRIPGFEVFLKGVANMLDAEHAEVTGRLRPVLASMNVAIEMTSNPLTSCPNGTTLSDFVLGDLDPREALRIAGHVVQCRNCFQVVGAMKELQSKVK